MVDLQIGQIYKGFQVLEKAYLKDLSSYGILLKDENTGLSVYYIDSDDKECAFSYSFKTLPFDDSGVFHIIEHTILSGSDKYRVKDPFMGINRASCNTFLNAMTYPDRTLYPASSVHEKDLDNIFKVYTDAVFKPLLREETFMQEGIRIVKGEDGNLMFDGVVYHEMEGALNNHESVALKEMIKNLFISGPYSYEAGGVPESISHLDYEQYLDTYHKFYTPQNCLLYLYGKNIDLGAKLGYLRENYLERKGSETIPLISDIDADKGERKIVVTSPSIEGSMNSSILLGWLVGSNVDLLESVTANIVVDLLLSSQTSPLYKRILLSGIGEDLAEQSGVYNEFYQMPFILGFSESREDRAEEAQQFLLSALSEIAEEGFSREEIEAALSRRKFAIREVKTLLGLRSFFSLVRYLERGMSLERLFDSNQLFKELERRLDEDPKYFETWIKYNLIDNKNRLLLVVKPDSSFLEKEEEKLKESLNERSGDYSEDKENRFKDFLAISDENDGDLPTLSIKDLPHDIVKYDVSHLDKVRALKLDNTGRILYGNLFFDISDFSLDSLRYAYLFTRLFSSSGTDKISGDRMQTKLKLNFGSISSFIELGNTSVGECKVCFAISFKALSEKYGGALDLLSDYILNIRLEENAIRDCIVDICSSFKQDAIYSGSYFTTLSASRRFSSSMYLSDEIFGLSSWTWFENLKKADIGKVKAEIELLLKRIFVKEKVFLNIATEEDLFKAGREGLEKFESSLSESRKIFSPLLPDLSRETDLAYLSPTNVSFNALAFKSSSFATREQVEEMVLAKVLTSKALWNEIRAKGGAYGAECHVEMTDNIFVLSSYRDPRILGTRKDFVSVLKDAVLLQEDLDNAIISRVGDSLKPVSMAMRALTSIRHSLYDISDEDRQNIREWELGMDLSSLERARLRLVDNLEDNVFVTLTSSESYKKEKLSIKRIELPF